jgi:predicted alpha/beta-fold hydrolase
MLANIRVPTLIIHSRDDPFLPSEPLEQPDVRANRNLIVHLTARGGHVGFIEQPKRDIDRAWAENRVLDFFLMTDLGGCTSLA